MIENSKKLTTKIKKSNSKLFKTKYNVSIGKLTKSFPVKLPEMLYQSYKIVPPCYSPKQFQKLFHII